MSELQNSSPEDHCRHINFQALDTAVATISNKFNWRGYNMQKGPSVDLSRPVDVLVPNWSLSHPAAFDLKVIHLLNICRSHSGSVRQLCGMWC